MTEGKLTERLAAQPEKFDFYRAVRALEAEHRDLPRVGASIRLPDDFLRFCQNPSLAFAPSTLENVQEISGVLRLFVNFLGMFGPNGPLPQHLTDFARDRQRNMHDPTFARFVDIFHHRMISFFYRAWASNQKSADFDRPENARFADYFGSFFGIGSPSLHHRDSVPDVAKIFFSGHLSAQPKNAEGLGKILLDYFRIPTRIEEFAGCWMRIPYEDQCRLGESSATGTLGLTALVGERKYESQLKFRIRMGPMKLTDLLRLMPNGANFKRLKDWVLNYVNLEFFWDLQCVVQADEVPGTCLGIGAPLGWATWLKSKPFSRDAEDPIFESL